MTEYPKVEQRCRIMWLHSEHTSYSEAKILFSFFAFG